MTLEVREDKQAGCMLLGAAITIGGAVLYVKTMGLIPHLAASVLIRSGMEATVDAPLQGERFTPKALLDNTLSAGAAILLSRLAGDFSLFVGGFTNCADVLIHGGTPDGGTFVTGTVAGVAAGVASRAVRVQFQRDADLPEIFRGSSDAMKAAFRCGVEGLTAGAIEQMVKNVCDGTPAAAGLFRAALMGAAAGATLGSLEQVRREINRERHIQYIQDQLLHLFEKGYSDPNPFLSWKEIAQGVADGTPITLHFQNDLHGFWDKTVSAQWAQHLPHPDLQRNYASKRREYVEPEPSEPTPPSAATPESVSNLRKDVEKRLDDLEEDADADLDTLEAHAHELAALRAKMRKMKAARYAKKSASAAAASAAK